LCCVGSGSDVAVAKNVQDFLLPLTVAVANRWPRGRACVENVSAPFRKDNVFLSVREEYSQIRSNFIVLHLRGITVFLQF
jgi:hypothetical protein